MAVRFVTILIGCLAAAAAACHTARSQPRYRYEPAAGASVGLQADSTGSLAVTVHGARIAIDLSWTSAPIVVTVENPGREPVEVSFGAQATTIRGTIGEVLQRPLRAATVGGGDYQPYASMQPFAVDGGSRAVFHLDNPFGREPSYGQYNVFELEAKSKAGQVERRSLPLVVGRASSTGAGR